MSTYNTKKSNTNVIDLLTKASNEERDSLRTFLGTEKVDAYDLIKEISSSGGHSVANFLRVGGVPYSEVVYDVYNKLKVHKQSTSLYTENPSSSELEAKYLEAETKVIQFLFGKLVNSLNENQREEMLAELNKQAESYGATYKGTAITVSSMSAASMGGFGTYMMASSVVGGLSGVLGITLPFAFYTSMSSTIATLTGPVGWAGVGAFLVYKVGTPNYKKTIPAVAIIAAIRQRIKFEEERKKAEQEEKKRQEDELQRQKSREEDEKIRRTATLSENLKKKQTELENREKAILYKEENIEKEINTQVVRERKKHYKVYALLTLAYFILLVTLYL